MFVSSSNQVSLHDGLASPSRQHRLSTKRRRSGSLLSEAPEGVSELCIDSHVRAWDYPLSRGEKICRVLHLLEAEVDAAWALASGTEDFRAKAVSSKTHCQLEHSQIAEPKVQVATSMPVDQQRTSNARSSALSLDFEDIDSVEESSLQGCSSIGRHLHEGELYLSDNSSSSDTEPEGEMREKTFKFTPPEWPDECHVSVFNGSQENSADAPCDNLLAQLLLSEPLVPMLADEVPFEDLSQNLSSMVTPRCHAALGRSSIHRPRNAVAPLGIGCLNLNNLENRDHEHAQEKEMVPNVAPQGHISTLVTARRPLLHEGNSAVGNIAAVRWGGVDVVQWMNFVTRESLDTEAALGETYWDGELVLEKGETIQVLRGCTEGVDEGLADWIVLVTSKLRSRKIGNLHGSLPTLSFIAAPGCEICDLVLGSDGRLSSVKQIRI